MSCSRNRVVGCCIQTSTITAASYGPAFGMTRVEPFPFV
jgi:hypothetical protein